MKKLFLIIVTLVLALVLVACDKKPTEKEVTVQSIKVSGSSQVKLGEYNQLKYTLNPVNAVTTVTWSTSDASIATVDDNGKVYGAALGVVKITATTANGKSNTKVLQVKEELDPEYPDLGGYTIRIAHSEARRYEYDPFVDEETQHYEGLDVVQAQEAWNWVEENFNCHIEVVAYPSDTKWPYTDYALTQARNNTSQYDFMITEDEFIPELVSGNALLNLYEWYSAYGQNFMDPAYFRSGSYKGGLYSISPSVADIYNTLGYNVNLVNEIIAHDPTLEEPAKMFNDDNWDMDVFYDWCKKAQAVLDSEHPGEGYYVVSGQGTFYWVGMCNSSGVSIADCTNYKMNLTGDVETQAADLVKKLVDEGLFDPAFGVDGHVTSWQSGKAVFNSGEYWFYNDSQRCPSDLWGEGDLTQYGYVPFPALPGTHKDEYKMGVSGGQVLLMPAYKDYTGYGDECTAENIYWAMCEYFIRKKQLYEASDGYDKVAAMEILTARRFSSTESIKAYVYLNLRCEEGEITIYDPMLLENNSIANTSESDFAKACNNWFKGTNTATATWAETVEPFKDILEQTLARVKG